MKKAQRQALVAARRHANRAGRIANARDLAGVASIPDPVFALPDEPAPEFPGRPVPIWRLFVQTVKRILCNG